jgi:site-specific DNA-methyltransferase (adenine-specific)
MRGPSDPVCYRTQSHETPLSTQKGLPPMVQNLRRPLGRDRENQSSNADIRAEWRDVGTGDSPPMISDAIMTAETFTEPVRLVRGNLSATLYCGDCLEILPSLTGIDAVITDPPYGIADCWRGGFNAANGWGKAGLEVEARNEWDATAPDKSTFDLLRTIGDVQCFWGGNYFPLPVSRGWLIWNKPERGFSLSEAELAWTSREMPMRVYDFRRSDTGRTHPTQKPVSVMAWAMEQCKVPEGATVLDPYMGSGTTGIACLRTVRNFIGIEKDPKHFATAVARIEREVAQGVLL